MDGTIVFPGEVYRITRAPDAWRWPDWSLSTLDGTFGSPWDDPFALYRVLLLSTSRLDVFIESTAVFRADDELVADLDPELDHPMIGVIPDQWIATRVVGSGYTRGLYINLCDPKALADTLDIVGSYLTDVDFSEITPENLLTLPVGVTRSISRTLYAATDPHGANVYDGLVYPSLFRPGIPTLATFETGSVSATVTHPIGQRRNVPITRDDPDLNAAMLFHGLTFEDGSPPQVLDPSDRP